MKIYTAKYVTRLEFKEKCPSRESGYEILSYIYKDKELENELDRIYNSSLEELKKEHLEGLCIGD
ncbi:MAG: hypothetical protein LBQ60_16465 [Bacteroidales bacterium]|jgi:hypothetical protein|nr:hypothetical protein [Bacteroidales bacterium]